MKKLILAIGLMGTVAAFSSCEDGKENDGKTAIVQDSLITVLPTWQALKIKIEDNRTEMNVIVGDASFFTASPQEKARKAEELGKLILRIYGKGNYLEKGNLVVTKDVRNNSETPADGISTPIPFSELKKAGF
ncbi:MAG: hypothetical protein H7257_00425 [Taibaiella sp.]|nr:hypothetical protein [Taibaiella sp.]